MYAWGHPDGLEGGKNEKALDELIKHIGYAHAIGAPVMRVVGSSLLFRHEPHGPQLEKLTTMFSKAAKVAEKYKIKPAVENHIDYNSDEILKLLQDINSPYMGITFDSGNFLRVMDDPIKAMEKLAAYVFATPHQDLKPPEYLGILNPIMRMMMREYIACRKQYPNMNDTWKKGYGVKEMHVRL